MEINEISEGDIAVLALSGQMDSNTSKQLEDVLPQRVQRAPGVVLDLSGVQYVSSAGLRVMLRGAKLARGAGHTLVLAGLTPPVSEVIQVSGFSAIFRIYANRSDALAALASQIVPSATDDRRAD